MRSPWRFVTLLVAAAFLLVGVATIAGSLADGEAVVSGLVVGAGALALGAVGVWRSLVAGVKYSPDGLEVRRIERTSRLSWCAVRAVETRLTSGDILFFLKQAEIVLVLEKEKEVWLGSLAVYSFSSTIPKRVEQKAEALRAALELHRGEHVNCAPVGD